MPMSDKLKQLQAMLEKQPRDTFLLYALGMEHKKLNEPLKAIEFFERTTQVDSNYCYAYFQKGQVLESTGDLPAAKRAYNDGIAAAKRCCDAHAQSELEGALSMID